MATGALSAVVLAHDNRLTGTVGYLAGGFLAVYLIAHFAVRKLAPAADPLLLPIMACSTGSGWPMIYRLDLAYADRARQLGKPIPSGRAELQLAYSFVAVLVLIAVLCDHPRPPHARPLHLHLGVRRPRPARDARLRPVAERRPDRPAGGRTSSPASSPRSC